MLRVAVAVFGKRKEKRRLQRLMLKFLRKAAPHQFFGWALKSGTYRQSGSRGHVLLPPCCQGLFFLNNYDLVPPLVCSFLLLFFTLNIRTVNQAVLNPPLAIVHIYVPEKNGISCPPIPYARRCSHPLLQRARRAFRHLQPRSSNGISANLSERCTALLHWQSFGGGLS